MVGYPKVCASAQSSRVPRYYPRVIQYAGDDGAYSPGQVVDPPSQRPGWPLAGAGFLESRNPWTHMLTGADSPASHCAELCLPPVSGEGTTCKAGVPG